MTRNGLFIVSLGLLAIMYSATAAGTYNFNALITGFVLVAIGGYVFFRGNKKEKEAKKLEQKDKTGGKK